MCGIVTCRTHTSAVGYLLTALRRLEYRGYDSVRDAITGHNAHPHNECTGRITPVHKELNYRWAEQVESRRFAFLKIDILAPELTDIVAGTDPSVIFHLAAQVNPDASTEKDTPQRRTRRTPS